MRSAQQLAQDIASGALTSEELIKTCLEAIEKDNLKGKELRAIISVRPVEQALRDARARDEEIKAGKSRGPLHGIPIVLKDAIVTGPELGMTSTAGAEVIKAMKPKHNAEIVDRLIDAGLIILGKANLTEFCGLKDESTPIGYSTVFGQTLSTFRKEGLDEKDQPHAGGSSVGSAVSIAAGFVPLAIGTETGGSNVFPASANGAYGLTLTYGTVPVKGIWRISSSFDKIGVMAAYPEDLALLADIISDSKTENKPEAGEKFKVGFVDVCWGGSMDEFKEKWENQRTTYDGVVTKVRSICDKVVHPLDLKVPSHLEYEGNSLFQIALWECNDAAEEFLSGFENGGVTDIPGMVQWNKDHAEVAMPEHHPGQSLLEQCITLRSSISPELRLKTISEIQRIGGPEGIDKVMQDNDVDIVISNSDTVLVSYTATIGWPIATMPFGTAKNGQPVGFFIAARKGQEGRLVRFMQAAKEVLGQ